MNAGEGLPSVAGADNNTGKGGGRTGAGIETGTWGGKSGVERGAVDCGSCINETG